MPSFALSRRQLLTAAPAFALASPVLAQGREELPGLAPYLAAIAPTALLVERDGKVLASHGDPARKVSVASVRKSLIGALYGIAVQEGRIRLDAMLSELGIDGVAPALTEVEKRATVADLLKARSGIYHVAAYETADQRRTRPVRGSHPPGTFWFYNNWDFNALGTIYRQQTGEDIFESFARRIAGPIGMRDFGAGDGRYISEPVSQHPAYVFSLSTRDMLRFGELVLAEGRWQGREIVPARWFADSLTPYSPSARGRRGYGYLWWTLPPDLFGPGAGFASGTGGQFIAVVPSHRLVLAQTVAAAASGKHVTRHFVRLLRGLVVA